MTTKVTADERAGRVAAKHHGLITAAQALRCGLSSTEVSRRAASGRWERVGRGVYRIRGAPESPAQATYVAVLAAGDSARAAGLSALSLFHVCDAPATPQLVVPRTSSARTANADVRRSTLDPTDCTQVGPIRCTTPARALLDAARLLTYDVLAELVDEVLCRQLATPSRVFGAIRRSGAGPGRAGAHVLRAALEPWLAGLQPGSPAEMRLLRRLEGWGLPVPVRQHAVSLGSGRKAFLDLAWPAAATGVEYDGARHHTPRSLGADVAREERLRALGWRVLRADRHDLQPSSTRLRDELVPLLSALVA